MPTFAVAGATYIYIAIRRGPMKTPTTGTSVFNAQLGTSGSPSYTTTFAVDAVIDGYLAGGFSESHWFVDRLRGAVALASTSTAAESSTYASYLKFDYSNGALSTINYSHVGWVLGRAPGFFDVVCYTGTGYQSQNAKTHALGVTPELIIVKRRNSADDWLVYNATSGKDKTIYLNRNFAANTTGGGFWGDGAVTINPTASVFYVGDRSELNSTGNTYVAYLFASCPGVSKVGSYTGNGSSQTINCGFTGGARFILIKRTDSSGDWYVWDTARGIVSTDDPYLLLNSTAAEVGGGYGGVAGDSVDPDNTGFIVNQVSATNINVSSAAYIFLAIA
jgi:hypothetical protein